MLLTHAEIGEEYIILNIDENCSERTRLMDLGIISGAEIKPLFKSMLGEPTAYGICGTVIALRKSESDLIRVIKRDNNEAEA